MPFFLFLLFFLFSTPIYSDISTDRAALLSLRTSLSGRTLLWNTTLTSPCSWQGIGCDDSQTRVISLRLPASSLFGQIPSNTISNLSNLRTLSLRFNHLSGPIPNDISRLTQLRNLYLQGNGFSGPVPETLFVMRSLVRVNLGENNFSGQIPSGFGNLTRLRTLYLESNNFGDSLPDIVLPNLEQFNVSFNPLMNGSVPRGFLSQPQSAFLGTNLCGGPLNVVCVGEEGEAPSSPTNGNGSGSGNRNRRRLSGGAIAGIVIGCVVGFILLLLVLFLLCRKRRGKKSRAVDVGEVKNQENERVEKPIMENEAVGVREVAKNEVVTGKKLIFFGNASQVFDLEELLRASAEVLGKGTFGTAYKAVLEMGMTVAVKRLKDVTISEKEFRDKIEAVGAMDHTNLVPLRAYYYSREEKLLVYDYMPMGSLSALLHGNKGAGRTPLNWKTRSGIALGSARGIEYLHSQSSDAAHGNIKSSNILLTKSHDARVSDFGLNGLVGPPSSPTRVAGYRAPEVTDPRRVTQKADVYSFGVLLLELLTGKAPTHALLNEEGVDLPRWVQSVVREEWTSEVFDVELLRDQSMEDEMVQLLQLAVDCTAQYPDNRPSISEVCKRIEELRRMSLRDDQELSDHVSETD